MPRLPVRLSCLPPAAVSLWVLVPAYPAARALAQGPPPAPSGPCATPEHRQFDFWLGDWEVRAPDGRLVGHNRITQMLGGCVLQESWRGVRGRRGASLNIYDASRGRWHQTWVDDGGLLLQLDGAFADGRMVLTGESVDSAGKPARQRITWEPLSGGRIRQLWESSSGGVAWKVEFEGIYSRRRPPS